MIKGIAHACYQVSDLAHSIEFYTEVLGLRVAFEFRNDEGRLFGVYLWAGERTFIELFEADSAREQPGARASFRHVALEIDDIHETVAKLRARGVEVTEIMLGSDGAYQAWFADPDGNRYELHHYTDKSNQTRFLSGL